MTTETHPNGGGDGNDNIRRKSWSDPQVLVAIVAIVALVGNDVKVVVFIGSLL